MRLNFFIFTFTFVFYFKLIQSYTFNASEILANPYNYRHVLCSGNGEPFYNSTTNEVICACKESYTNEPRNKKKKFLNGHLVQCSYKKKSRFTALFYALCLPLGFDFLYLGRYKIFAVIFILTISIISLNIAMFIVNYKINMQSKENKVQQKRIKVKKIGNQEKNEYRKEKIIKILNIVANIGLLNHILYMVVDVILHLAGIIDDSNDVKTENDLNYLFVGYNDED